MIKSIYRLRFVRIKKKKKGTSRDDKVEATFKYLKKLLNLPISTNLPTSSFLLFAKSRKTPENTVASNQLSRTLADEQSEAVVIDGERNTR